MNPRRVQEQACAVDLYLYPGLVASSRVGGLYLYQGHPALVQGGKLKGFGVYTYTQAWWQAQGV